LRKGAKTNKKSNKDKGRQDGPTTVPENYHGMAMPRGMVLPPQHRVAMPPGTAMLPLSPLTRQFFLFNAPSVFLLGVSSTLFWRLFGSS